MKQILVEFVAASLFLGFLFLLRFLGQLAAAGNFVATFLLWFITMIIIVGIFFIILMILKEIKRDIDNE